MAIYHCLNHHGPIPREKMILGRFGEPIATPCCRSPYWYDEKNRKCGPLTAPVHCAECKELIGYADSVDHQWHEKAPRLYCLLCKPRGRLEEFEPR